MSAERNAANRLLVGPARIRGSSPAEMSLLVQTPTDQQRRHRHSPVPDLVPQDFRIGGQSFSVDGLHAGYIGVAFHNTGLGPYPQGTALDQLNGGRPHEPGDKEKQPSPAQPTKEQKEVRPRMNADQARSALFFYYDKPQPRLDLDWDWSVRVISDGINEFKKYNTHSQPKSDYAGNGAFGLGDARPFRVPNHNRYPFLFPNDTRVMSLADEFTPQDRELVESALDKMVHLYKRKGIIPNYSAQSSLDVPGRPVFLSTALEWYLTHPDKETEQVREKFQLYMEIGAQEHNHIWNNEADLTGAIGTPHAMVPGYKWLRRAGDMDTGQNGYNSSRVMGWDRSGARFGGSEEAALPICLNSILLRNKQILAFAADELGVPLDGKDAFGWKQDHAEMAKELHTELFDPFRGTYVDGDHEDHTRIGIVSLASVWSLIAELPEGDDALSTIGQLAYLDTGKGLLTTSPLDSLPEVSAEALEAAGVPHRATKAFNKLLRKHNWDELLWPLEQVAATEGMIKYILSNDKGLNLQARLAVNRFTQKLVHDRLENQLDVFLKTGKFPEKMLPNGELDNGSYQYEHQVDGLGATPAVTELDINVFLPLLYKSEDALLQAIEAGEKNIDLMGMRMDVIRDLQEKRAAEPDAAGQVEISQVSQANELLKEGTIVAFPPVFLPYKVKNSQQAA